MKNLICQSESIVEAGCRDSCIVLRQINDEFVTHVSYQQDGVDCFCWGNYFKGIIEAVADFQKRCADYGVEVIKDKETV